MRERIVGHGFIAVAIVRIVPIAPYSVVGFMAGAARIHRGDYLIGTALGMLPGTLLYAYLGAIGKAGLTGGKEGRSPLEWTFLGLGLLATIAVTVFVSRLAKNTLKQTGATKK